MNILPVTKTLQSKGRLLCLATPVVMGILNATPNSFYNKGSDSALPDLLRNAETMLSQGAAILDIGGASTKPGEPIIDEQEELRRVIPAIGALSQQFPEAWLSVDTYHASVAEAAIDAGAHMVNDVSAGNIDRAMLTTVAALKVPYIAMHMQGTPATMQLNPEYADVVSEVLEGLRKACDDARSAGIHDIVIDPGFGFGKTLEHNYALLKQMGTFKILGRPVLAGVSRKSIVCKALKVSPADALNGTTALHMAALQQGADILRVHDVKEAVEVVKLFGWLK